MKKLQYFILLLFFASASNGQAISADRIFVYVLLSPSRLDRQLADDGFVLTGKFTRHDTLLRIYGYRRSRTYKSIDSVSRSVSRTETPEGSFIAYTTSSEYEYNNLRTALKKDGFYCKREAAADSLAYLVYQNKERAVRTSVNKTDSLTTYTLEFHKKVFPRAKDIYYANDLLTFSSHEFLVYYFGEKNVKTDTYFLSDNQSAMCSVLFLNTNRQVVFIWGDQENRCDISSLLFGGQLRLKSAVETGKYVAENNWVLKSGIRPGMSLLQLRMLNGNDFRFYGGKSIHTGAVIPDSTGNLNFRKEEITLGCLNCNDDKFATAKEVNADASLRDGRILFVLSVTVNPSLN